MFTKHILRFLLIFASLVLLTGCSWHGSKNLDSSDSATYSSELSSILPNTYKKHDFPGALLAIRFKDGSIFIDSIGYSDTSKKIPLKPTQQFRIGSTTKTITATAILTLYQDGLLSLDDSVSSLLPELKTTLDGDITIRMLLNHTSGLKEYMYCSYQDSDWFDSLIENPRHNWEPKDLVNISLSCDEEDSPKNTFLYSNTNYILLGMIIESITKKSYENYVKENIFNKLNLKYTTIPIEDGFDNEFARGYFEKNEDGVLYDYSIQSPSYTWAAGAGLSTALELLGWVEVFASGYLLDEDTYKEQRESIDIGGDARYGLGMLIENDGSMGHNGSVLGYQTQMFYKDGVSIVIYTNSYYRTKENPTLLIYRDVVDIIFD